MLRRFLPVVALSLAVGLAACGSSTPAGVAAEVNGEEISGDLLARLVAGTDPTKVSETTPPGDPTSEPTAGPTTGGPGSGGATTPTAQPTTPAPALTETPEQTAERQRQLLTALIGAEVVRQFASDRGVTFSDDQVQEQLAQGGDEVRAQAENLGMSPEEFVRLVLAPDLMLADVLAEVAGEVDEAAVQAAYDAAAATGQLTNATLSHILVPTEQEALAALALIEAGSPFEAVAADFSTDGSAADGGLLGQDVPLSNFVPEFAEAAAQAPIGEVVGPVQSQFGFHLIKVDERGEAPLETIEADLRNQLASEDLTERFDEAFATAEVTVPSRFGVWDGETRTVVADPVVGDPVVDDPTVPEVATPSTG